jgi:16S rRNA (guanine966-N2)-methyltransferase
LTLTFFSRFVVRRNKVLALYEYIYFKDIKFKMMEARRSPHIRPRVFRRPNETDTVVRPSNGGKPFFRDGGSGGSGGGASSHNQPHRPPKKFLRNQPEIKITNDMQVTDGKHKGVQLRSTDSPKVRPTARRVRETLFKVLGRRIRFARFLDLCAGSGAVGVEAISRGALIATFVERSTKMCHFIEQNLKACEICHPGHGEICNLETIPFLKRMAARRRQWDLIYYDPPYEANYDEVLEIIGRGAAIRPQGGVLIVEHHAEMFFPQKIGCLNRRKVVREGDSALTFYERWK